MEEFASYIQTEYYHTVNNLDGKSFTDAYNKFLNKFKQSKLSDENIKASPV